MLYTFCVNFLLLSRPHENLLTICSSYVRNVREVRTKSTLMCHNVTGKGWIWFLERLSSKSINLYEHYVQFRQCVDKIHTLLTHH